MICAIKIVINIVEIAIIYYNFTYVFVLDCMNQEKLVNEKEQEKHGNYPS